MLDQIGIEEIVMLLGAVLGAVWTFFKATEYAARLKDKKYSKALRFLEAGVWQTYITYVHHIKEARADGKLTDIERQDARNMAYVYAKSYAEEEGLNLVEELSKEYIPTLITHIVRKLKSKSITKPIAVVHHTEDTGGT